MTFPQLFFFVFFFFFQQHKSPSQRQICVTHAPLTQLIPLFPMGCLGGDEVYFWTLYQILIIENISEATGQHLAHMLLTKPAGYVEAVSRCLFESSLSERANCQIGKSCDLRNWPQGDHRKLGTPKVEQWVTAFSFIFAETSSQTVKQNCVNMPFCTLPANSHSHAQSKVGM